MDTPLIPPARWRVHGAPPAADGSNVLLFFHSLTGEPDPAGWWPRLVGPGRLLDTRQYALVAPDLVPPAQVSPASAVPPLSIRTMAGVATALLDQLGIGRIRLAVGGSVGGMVALEWAAACPNRARDVVVFAAPAVHPAQATGWNHVQRQAIRMAAVEGSPARGLALARMLAMLTYRTPDELELRFGSARRPDGLPQVASWLEHHGARLVERFDPDRYLALLDAMDGHDVGQDRGGIETALSRVRARLHGVGIRGDQLYPPELVRGWVEAATRGPGAGGSPTPRYHEIDSLHGHDAFLLEEAQVGRILADVLGASASGRDLPGLGKGAKTAGRPQRRHPPEAA